MPKQALDELLGEYDEVQETPSPTPPDAPDVAPTVSTPSRGSRPSRVSTPSRPSRGSRPSTPSSPAPSPEQSIAPERDFARVANSIIREAVPAGVFAGKRKQLYDFLYSLTRGAVVPKRTIRIAKDKLMAGASIGSEVTLRTHLTHLRSAGLIDERVIPGAHGGNEYTVFLPEEIVTKGDETPSRGSRGSRATNPPQFLEGLEALETRGSRGGLSSSESDIYEAPNTFFKTYGENDDDDEFARFVEIFREARRSLTGGAVAQDERERWAELARLIVAELREAASKTEVVSSVPAFLTAHLRRRFAQPSQPSARKGGGKTGALAEEVDGGAHPAGQTPARRLTPDEIAEQSRLIAELLDGGYTLEQAEAQFAGSFHADDWAAVREAVREPE